MARRTDPSPATVKVVRARDGHACVRCGNPYSLTTQHRVGRGMGGTRLAWVNLPANLITLCGSGTTGCHGWVESHPTEAMALGLAVSRLRATPPLLVPVRYAWGWLILDNDGNATPVAAPV